MKKVSLKALIATAVIVGAVLLYKWYQGPMTLYGKPITYDNTFKYSSQAFTMGDRIIYHSCEIEDLNVVATDDTVEFRKKNVTIGVKPLYITNKNNIPCLVCRDVNGDTVLLIRFKSKDELPDSPKNEELLYVNNARSFVVVLSNDDKCQGPQK